MTISADRVVVGEDEIAAPWSELAHRLEEAAVVRVLDREDRKATTAAVALGSIRCRSRAA